MLYETESRAPENAALTIGRLEAEVQRLKDALETIGDWAHDRSTGPTVLDDLWEVRRMAYTAMDTPSVAEQQEGGV